MRKQTPKLEWQVVENDEEWARQQALLAAAAVPATGYRLHRQNYVGNVLALLLLLVMAGAWWRTSQVEKPQRADAATVATPQAPGAITPGPSSVMDSQGRNAMESPTQGIREESLATPYFLYHFHRQDAVVVRAVAPQMDALYTTLWHNLGLPISLNPDRLVINVTIKQLPRQAPSVFGPVTMPLSAHYLMPGDPPTGPSVMLSVSVPSPAIYLAPVTLRDVDLLAQSIALPLLAHSLAQARAQHQIGPAWQPLLDGLYLWQVWDLDLPLATWRETVVTWQYRDLPSVRPEEALPLPQRYQELCAAHKLWLRSPMQLHIPLVCAGQDSEEQNWHMWRAPVTALAQLDVPSPLTGSGGSSSLDGSPFYTNHPGQTVALATLIAYAVDAYGRESLPTLVAGLGHATDWTTLIPSVYGVSATEFEAGWQTDLTTHYGVTLTTMVK